MHTVGDDERYLHTVGDDEDELVALGAVSHRRLQPTQSVVLHRLSRRRAATDVAREHDSAKITVQLSGNE